MVLWDCVPTLGLDEYEPTEEIQISSVNVTTINKGPIMDESLILPKIRKIQEIIKNISSTTQTHLSLIWSPQKIKFQQSVSL